MIERGLSDLSVHSLNFDRYFTYEEMEQNRQEAERLNKNCVNSPEWLSRCENISKDIYSQMLPIAELLNSNYDMHQYTEEKSSLTHFRSNWDLFFYSNRGWNGKEYFDYMQISFNEKRNACDNMNLLNNILSLLNNCEVKNVACRIQYNNIDHENDIANEAKNVFEKIGNKFITYNGMTGKIKLVND